MSVVNPGIKLRNKQLPSKQIKINNDIKRNKFKNNQQQKSKLEIKQKNYKQKHAKNEIRNILKLDDQLQSNAIDVVQALDLQDVKNGNNVDIISGEVQTVFRVAPYKKETLMKQKQNPAIRILFLDEGNSCRSLLAQALTSQVLDQLHTPLPVSIHSASIGAPIQEALKDQKLSIILKQFNLKLPLNNHQQQIFSEMNDMVDFDLVLVMDRFDYEDVYKEVSVVDVINPGNHFTNRVKCLGEFRMMLKGEIDLDALEINDPFYGTLNEEEQLQNMFDTAREIQQASIGLVAFLLALNKCTQKNNSNKQFVLSHQNNLKESLEQSLQCPLLSEHAIQTIQSTNNTFSKQKNKNNEKKLISQDEQNVPKKAQYGYWKKFENVEKELKEWMNKNSVRGRMPSQRELRRSGANSLAASIDRQGGFSFMAQKLGLPVNQQCRGYWDEPGNLEWALAPYLAKAPNGQIYVPSQKFLQQLGRNDLIGAIRKCGGHKVVAKRLGVNFRHGKYTSVDNLLQEIQNCLLTNGWKKKYRLPTSGEFDAIGRSDITNGIRKFGGFCKVAKLLSLDYEISQKKQKNSNNRKKQDLVEIVIKDKN